MKKSLLVILLLAAVIVTDRAQAQAIQSFDERLVIFESVLEEIQQELKIPGMSAAVVKDRELVWTKGFGYADLENNVKATPRTAYYLASLTKTFASTILMQFVERGELDLDAPVGRYGVRIKGPGTIRIRHLLSHTSEGIPGSYYKYDGGRFAHLGRVIKRASGRSFETLLMENIVQPLSMNDTVPGIRRENEEYSRILPKMAKPYLLDSSGRIVESEYPTYFGVSAGLISTVTDMARYLIAIDANALISSETQQIAFSPQPLISGSPAPYGLGWFVQQFEGTPLIWHYGFNPRIVSTLILYAPDRDLAFIVLANSDNLSRPFWLGLGNVLTSPAAVAFVKLFITAETVEAVVPEISWKATIHEIAAQIEHAQAAGCGEIVKQELVSRFMMLRQFGEWEQARGFIDIYADLYTRPYRHIDLPPIASIELVQNDQYRIVEFEMKKDAKVRVHAVGESDYYRLYDFGGIEEVLKRQLIWRMRLEQSEDAGGALKNRKVDDIVELPKGTYRLHYRTDGAHSFDRWNDIPPDERFWGISLYLADPFVQVGDVVGGVRTIQAASGRRLLDTVEFDRGQPPITPWEYFAFVIFLIILASAIVYLPVRLFQRRLAEDKRSFTETVKPRWRWMSWIAAINSVICLGHILPALLAGRLKGLIATGVPIIPGVWWAVLISLPLLSASLVLFLVIAVGISWRKQLWNPLQRIYYTLVVAVAAGYLVLLNHWRLIILPA